MWGRLVTIAIVLLIAGPARAQTLTEPGWTPLWSTPVDAASVALSIDTRGEVVVATAIAGLPGRVELRRITRSGSTVLTRAGRIAGVEARPDEVLFSGDDVLAAPNQLLRWRGSAAEIVTADFRAGSTADDEPGAVARVPAGWTMGSVLRPGELIVTDMGTNDVVYAVDPATGVARVVVSDVPAFDTLAGVVAVGADSTIYVADREARTLYAVLASGAAAGAPVALTVTGGIGGALVGVDHDPVAGQLLLAVGGTSDRILRLARTGATTFSAAVIGTGFDFADAAVEAIDLADDGTLLAVLAGGRVRVFGRCTTTAPASDCDANGMLDRCELALGAADCNGNRVLDACDVGLGTSSDCDSDITPDECAPTAPIDVTFVVSTSATNRPAADALCTNLGSVVSTLAAEGIVVTPHVLGVGPTPTDVEFVCLEASVGDRLGTTVPGSPPPTGGDPQGTLGVCSLPTGTHNDWAHAVAIVAERFAWAPGAQRVMTVLASQGPYCGSTAMNASDVDAATWAADRAVGADVSVSVMLGADYDDSTRRPTESLAVDLAAATRGGVAREAPGPRWVAALVELLRASAAEGSDCDDDGRSDVCQLAEPCADCDASGRLDVCDGPSLCETYFSDADGDLFGSAASPVVACAPAVGWVADATDCDDTAATVHPGAVEVPEDGIDQDCSGADACLAGGAPDGGVCPPGPMDAAVASDGSVGDGGLEGDAGSFDAAAALDATASSDAGALDAAAALDAAISLDAGSFDAALIDAGPRVDGGARTDGGTDAGTPPTPPVAGCACDVGQRSTGGLGWAAALGVAMATWRRRARPLRERAAPSYGRAAPSVAGLLSGPRGSTRARRGPSGSSA